MLLNEALIYIEPIFGVISALAYFQVGYKLNRNQNVTTNNEKETNHYPFKLSHDQQF